jgi:enoyl-CoA hydratase
MNVPEPQASAASAAEQVRYEMPAPLVARIVLDRPKKRNAQGTTMTYQLDAAIRRACLDDDVSVIILAAEGDHFCAGHDLSAGQADAVNPPHDPTNAARNISLWGQ